MNELHRIKSWFEQYKVPTTNLGQSSTNKYEEFSKGFFLSIFDDYFVQPCMLGLKNLVKQRNKMSFRNIFMGKRMVSVLLHKFQRIKV